MSTGNLKEAQKGATPFPPPSYASREGIVAARPALCMRSQQGNRMKKCVARYGKGEYTDAAMWDMAKLQYFACKKRKNGIDCYDKVVM